MYLLPSILDCTLRDLCDPCVGKGYHYFLRDVVFTLFDSWGNSLNNSNNENNDDNIDHFNNDNNNNNDNDSDSNNIDKKIIQLINHILKHTYSDQTNILSENIKSIGALTKILKNPWDGPFLNFGPILSLLTVLAGPTGGAYASASSKGTEGVKKRLAGLSILKVSTRITSFFLYVLIF